jgi:tetratricopeptide (TPR) repeat protein
LWEIDHAVPRRPFPARRRCRIAGRCPGRRQRRGLPADDDSAFSPEQRIAACNTLIKAARNAPKEVADALVNRGRAAWYADKMKQAFADLNRAIALDPNNARAFRERSNAYRSIGKLDRALADASEAVRLDPRDARPSTTAATCSSTRANTIARSTTTTKRCGSIRN